MGNFDNLETVGTDFITVGMLLSAKLGKDGVAVFPKQVSGLTCDLVGDVMTSLRLLGLIGDFWPHDGARELSFKK